MAVTTTKIADFAEALAEEVHNLSSDTIMIALSNTAPGSETSDPTATGNGVLANVTEVAYTNYSDDMTVDRTLENVTSDESGGTWTLDADNLIITASGGALADFRYIYVYNDTAANDELIVLVDAGETISLADTESKPINWNASGIVTIA